jgi:hypothetical protein
MPNEVLTEYLYCDNRRLDGYFEQISNPVTYDKVPMWKAGLGLTGPSVEGTQSRPGRPYTVHEKVQKVVSHLRTTKLLDRGRLAYHIASGREFRVEAMSARRAAIPPRKDFPGLSLWVSAEPDAGAQDADGNKIGALFLLENFRGSDDSNGLNFSGYSWLAFLAQVVDASETRGFVLSNMVAGLGRQFASNPIEALSHLGTVFAPERRVTALYRVRAVCGAEEQNFALTTIGYPLVVTAEGGLLDSVI